VHSNRPSLEAVGSPFADAAEALRRWLIDAACPLWSSVGIDWREGGFQEALNTAGQPVTSARRARVPPRQIYAFTRAAGLGWTGDATSIVEHGLLELRRSFLRSDGLYRTAITANGQPLDDRAFLYDQGFVLLGLAAAQDHLGGRADLRATAISLLAALSIRSDRHGLTFDAGLQRGPMLLSNPLMHLFEAALAWCEQDDDPLWQSTADSVGTLTLTRLVDPGSGCIFEQYGEDWCLPDSDEQRGIEPGHQFEWAWLLLRWRPDREDVRLCSRRLIDRAITHGIHHGAAVNGLNHELSRADDSARLWPQTEWIKAATRAAELFVAERYDNQVSSAVESLWAYLRTPMAGLWYDSRTALGVFVQGPSPASSFYHIVGAITELDRLYASRPTLCKK
jgi:mannose-6-phosphate isomerase